MAFVATTRKSNRLNKKENMVAWLYCAPMIIGILIFTLVPIILSVYSMFIDWTGYESIFSAEFIGFKNFYDVFVGKYSQKFYAGLLNTLVFLISLPISLLLGILLALAMNRKMRGAKTFRVIYYLPAITSIVAVTIIFQKLFEYDGTINILLQSIGLSKIKWLTDDLAVKITVNILIIWRNAGYTALMYIAGLQSVSTDQIEAAQIDGAGAFKRFTKITLPALYPVTFYLTIMGLINGLQLFSEPFILVKYGLADNAITSASFIYYYYNNDALGVAAVGAWALALLVFIVTAVQVAIDNKKEKY